MVERYKQIAVAWATRPLIWVVVCVALVGVVIAGVMGWSHEFQRGYPPSVPPMAGKTLSSAKQILQVVQTGQESASVQGLDLREMGSLELAIIVERSGSDENLNTKPAPFAFFPNVRWIHFGPDQLSLLGPDSLAVLDELESITVEDDSIRDEDLNPLLSAPSLRQLTLETIDLQANVGRLAALPNLSTLVLTHGSSPLPDRPLASPFRREILSQINQLRSLQRLALAPQWLPSLAYFAGSPNPDPASDPILKRNAAEILARHPSLQRLWIGSHELPREQTALRWLADQMPHVHVTASRFDRQRIDQAKLTLSVTLAFFVAIGFMLPSHFSPPSAQLTPHYKSAHKGFFLVVLACSVFTIGMLYLPTTLSGLLSRIAVATVAAAIGLVCHWGWSIAIPTGVRLAVWLPVGMIVATSLLVVVPYQPSFTLGQILGLTLDSFLLGQYPLAALALAVLAGGCVVACTNVISDQQRIDAEASLSPCHTLYDFQQRQQTLAMQFRRANHRQLDRWTRRVDELGRKLQHGSFWVAVRLCDLGGRVSTRSLPLQLLQAAVGMLAVFIVYQVGIGIPLTGDLIVLLISGWALILPAQSSIARREFLGIELLRCVSRRQFVRQRFALVIGQVSLLVAIVFILAWGASSVLSGWPEPLHVLRNAALALVLCIMGSGIVLWISILRSLIGASLLCLLGVVYVGNFIAAFTNKQPPSGPPLGVVLSSPLAMTIWSIAALAVLAAAYRGWMRAEFAAA